jgi:hypothetical protein
MAKKNPLRAHYGYQMDTDIANTPGRDAWRAAYRDGRCWCGKVGIYMMRDKAFCRAHKADALTATRQHGAEMDGIVAVHQARYRQNDHNILNKQALRGTPFRKTKQRP